MRGNHSALMILAFAATLTGCATTAPVDAVGANAYHVATSGAPMSNQADVNYRAVAVAHDYCARMHKELMFRQSQESGEHSWSAKREDLTFVCVSASDPKYLNAGLQSDETPVRITTP